MKAIRLSVMLSNEVKAVQANLHPIIFILLSEITNIQIVSCFFLKPFSCDSDVKSIDLSERSYAIFIGNPLIARKHAFLAEDEGEVGLIIYCNVTL